MRRSLLGLILIPFFIECSNNNHPKNIPLESSIFQERVSLNEAKKDSFPFSSKEQYYIFVENFIVDNFEKDVSEVYNFFNISLDFPSYFFTKVNDELCFRCEGAHYFSKSKKISFNAYPSEEMFIRYRDYHKRYSENFQAFFEQRLHYYIKHEAAHYFHHMESDRLGIENSFENSDVQTDEDILCSNLVVEGVADYMAYLGQIPPSTKLINPKHLLCDTNLQVYNLYSAGFYLVQPILDKDFFKGIRVLSEYPLNKNSLKSLKRYQNNLLKEMN